MSHQESQIEMPSLFRSVALDVKSPGPSLRERLAQVDAERLNQWTHGCGFLLSLIGGWVLVQQAIATGGLQRIVGCSIYAVSLILLYLASTLSHSFSDPVLRGRFRLLDQICIFLLAAGSYTPLGLVYLSSDARVLILVVMWVLAGCGIVERLYTGHERIRVPFYLMIGWVPVFVLGAISTLGGTPAVALVIAGGLCYSLGALFLVNDHRHPCLHAIWHLMTMTASTCHYLFILLYVAN
ncbi:MAG: hemolysin III family protein [Planctomycetaceae bacterium]